MNELGSTVIKLEEWEHLRNTMLAEGERFSTFVITGRSKERLGFTTRHLCENGWKTTHVALDWYDPAKKTMFLLRHGDDITITDRCKFNTGHHWRATDNG